MINCLIMSLVPWDLTGWLLGLAVDDAVHSCSFPQAWHHLTDFFHPQAKNNWAASVSWCEIWSRPLSPANFSVSLPAWMFHAHLSSPFSSDPMILDELFFDYFMTWNGHFQKTVYAVTPAAVSNSKTVTLFSHHPDTIFLGIILIHSP